MKKYRSIASAFAVSLAIAGNANADSENRSELKAEQIKILDQVSVVLTDSEPPQNPVRIKTEGYPRMIAWSPSVRIMSAKQPKIIVWSRSVKIVPRSDVLK